ncbi:hypothetical protein KIN20_018179 [Parelaphostrongylus tenuis]|uniref:Uncharacterized protein n=1 Tax=Parelaphostrongylus tenuis TaxID=148309 RepID=A0AAD5QPB8_PARTN|nr:hypothetical protein KIN20_018179 [Parelaphostrongylus tenuis]
MRTHLLCAMLCIRKSVAEGAINAEADRLLQHPLCTDIVEVDRRTFKFYPSPPALLKPLIERIRRGYSSSAGHEGRDDVANEEKRCMHEDVTKMKVACNFLLELIDRQRVLEQKNYVTWQSVQNRYHDMVSRDGEADKDLLLKYERYGLTFTEPILNSKVVKMLTGRSSIVKGLNQPIFHRIHYDISRTGMITVGFTGEIDSYSEEELKRPIEASKVSSRPRPFVSSDPRESRQPRDASLSRYKHDNQPPFSEVLSDGRSSGRRLGSPWIRWLEYGSRAIRGSLNVVSEAAFHRPT